MSKWFFTPFFLMLPNICHAINVGPVTLFVDSGYSEISNEIKNDSDQARLVTVSVTRISSPETGGVKIAEETDGEILLSPSRLVLPAKAKNNVRFFYKGPSDAVERYYRITWNDLPLSVDENGDNKEKVIASTSARINTILVVSPRKSNFEYSLDKNILKNNGNASYRVVAYGPCLSDVQKQCKETYYDLPGKKRKFKYVDIGSNKGHVGLWLGKEFVVVK